MDTKTWLQSIIAPLSPKPSVELQKFFTSCDIDVTTEILERADIVLMAIFPKCGPDDRILQGGLMVNVWSENRRLEAMKLYYKVLHTICTEETKNLTPLLINDKLHRCLLTFSCELVLAANSAVPMMISAIFERIGITAFDLIMVMEIFINDKFNLPRELKRHLNSLEEQFLECIVWEKGSSLYNTLKISRPSLSPEIRCLGMISIAYGSSVQKHEAYIDHNEEILSPKRPRKDCQSVLVERNLTPVSKSSSPSSIGSSPCDKDEICPNIAITIFFGKIEKLAVVRINAMVERLHYSHQMRKIINEFFQKILKQKTELFFNRHIDQIILCCFYGVAKILKLNPVFSEIVSSYSKQPYCKPQVLSGVFVFGTSKRSVQRNVQDHIPIIDFYNRVFLPAVKPILEELTVGTATDHSDTESAITSDTESAITSDCQSPISPKQTLFPNLPKTSPKRVSASHNVFVSPMRASKMETLISRSASRNSYAFVGVTTQPYRSPSKDLNAINNYLNCTRKVRRALDYGSFKSQFISDSAVDL